MECMKCGMSLGSHQVHPEEQCNRQQEINRGNLGVACRWCGHQAGDHKDGCPRKSPVALPGQGELPANLERDLRLLLPSDWLDWTPDRGPQ
jgi:DNA-directed RNA polymerase subunit RPC12/RpoP